jgi:hypothetical protein
MKLFCLSAVPSYTKCSSKLWQESRPAQTSSTADWESTWLLHTAIRLVEEHSGFAGCRWSDEISNDRNGD